MKKLLIALLLLPLICSAQNRLKDKTEAVTPASDDWLYLDGATNGVRKLSPSFLQPAPTYAALASDAITLGHDNIVRTATLTGTKNLTLTSGGSTGDWRELSFDVTGTQTITTNFAVKRNGASGAANVSQAFTDKAVITIINMGGGVYEWWDNLYTDGDLRINTAPTNFSRTDSSLAATIAGIDTKIGTMDGLIASGVGDSVGTIKMRMTSDLAARGSEWLLCDGTNGTPTIPDAYGASYIIKGNGTVATPTVDIPAGSYVGSQSVTASNATSGATMRYTLNGVDPTTSDTTVSGPITVASSATLKIKGWKNLYAASAVFSAAYTITSADLISEFFEGVGTPSGWVTGGTVTFDYSSSPLQGAESMQLTSAFASAYKDIGAGQTAIYGFFLCDTSGTNNDGLQIQDSSGALLAKIEFRSDRVNIAHGSATATTMGASLSPSAVWWDYTKSTGSDGVLTIYINKNSTSLIKPAASATITAGTSTAEPRRIVFASGNTASANTFDSVIVRTTSIGSTPY